MIFIYNSLLLFICSLNFAVLLEDNLGTSSYWDENQLALSEGQDDDLPEMLSESISQTMCDMGTQRECLSVTTLVSMVNDST